jgi:hypothetical protein
VAFDQRLEWDTAKVTNMNQMFCGADAYSQQFEI